MNPTHHSTKLGVNIDHVATIRQARGAVEPDPVAAAVLAELAGSHGITVHLRGDRRHIQDRDLELLRATITTRLNMEMAATPEMTKIAQRVRPEMVTLVPERPEEITTEGGLDLIEQSDSVARAMSGLSGAGIGVSLFIDPDAHQIEAAGRLGGQAVELNTASYAETVPLSLAERKDGFQGELQKLVESATLAGGKGLRVLAGHGLTYRNVGPVSNIPEIEELNIGHNIVSRAVLVGMERAVREMLEAMNVGAG